MRTSIDTYELRQFDIKLAQAGKSFDAATMGRTLKLAAKPMLTASEQEVPIGKTVTRSKLTRRTKTGKTRRDGTYDKGGATRRDLRIKSVPGVGDELIRVLIGVSKSSGHVGWRAHLITRRNKHRRVANDFLSRAETRTIDVVISRLGISAQQIVNKVLSSYAK